MIDRNRRVSARTRVARDVAALVSGAALIGVACGSPSQSVSSGNTDDGGNGSGGSSGSGPGSSGSTGSSGGGASGGSTSGGSASGSSGASSGSSSAASSSGSGSSSGSSSGATMDDGGACSITASSVRVTEIDVGLTYVYQEIDAMGGNNIGLAPLAISPIPSGGSRLAFMGSDGMVHVAQLDASDNLMAGSVFGLPAFDFQDIYADNTGGVLLVSRNAQGGGTGNCGTATNLCGTPPNPPDPCWDMYMVRFNGTTAGWATKLSTSSAMNPPYLTSKTDMSLRSYYIWWYAHNGRITSDGTNFAGYYGSAISVSQGGCINIHQGDEMRVVDPTGNILSGGFDWGCSHSAFERILWDGSKYVPVCNNDSDPGGTQTGQMAFAPNMTTIYPVNELNAELGAVVKAGGGGYWLVLSNVRPGQSTTAPALDDVHLVHTTTGMFDKDVTLASDSGLNDRAPHLAPFGTNRMLAAWETSTQTDHLQQTDTTRKLYVQALNATSGATQSSPYYVSGVTGSRYQDFRSYPDGSVAYAARGSTGTKVKIVRVLPCQ